MGAGAGWCRGVVEPGKSWSVSDAPWLILMLNHVTAGFKHVLFSMITTTNLSYRFPIFETSATALCGTTGIWDVILPIDFHIYQTGRYTTNQVNSVIRRVQ